jgi:S-adenosylmethionine:tRNA ribosyltransferase-isomerase
MDPEILQLEHYLYDLPEDKIAKFPLEKRGESKLLVYRDGNITHSIFKNIPVFLPDDSLMVFNNTRVIRARLLFHRATGAKIEVFCHEPAHLDENISILVNQKMKVEWKCLVGNKDKWRKNRETLELKTVVDGTELFLKCDYIGDERDLTIVKFSWNGTYSFYEILEIFGSTPIPPYLHRQSTESDVTTYQTIYALENGAVAAPTAGFHFTDEILELLKNKGTIQDYVTLHVGSGTFKPIKTKNIVDHNMHSEQVIINRKTIENLLKQQGNMVCVGTTSLRTIESLYWYGVKLIKYPQDTAFRIEKLFPYQFTGESLPAKNESLTAVLEYMNSTESNQLIGETSIFIFPTYLFRICDLLITNFHLPQSTLILLIAAFAGDDWKKIYSEAIKKDYRFLSYGDSSLIFRHTKPSPSLTVPAKQETLPK